MVGHIRGVSTLLGGDKTHHRVSCAASYGGHLDVTCLAWLNL